MGRKESPDGFDPPKDLDWEEIQKSTPTDHLFPKEPRPPQTDWPDQGDLAEDSPSTGHYFPEENDGPGVADESSSEGE